MGPANVSSVDVLIEQLRAGDRRALARTLSLVESGSPEERHRILRLLPPAASRSRIIGITGPPGVGKSTLTSAFAVGLRALGRRVAILSIDPSSPLYGGALLGDRVRMGALHSDPGVFIRSMASRGQLGGLALAAPQALAVLEAAGFDDLLVETVGVGQSEIQIARTADTVVLVLAAGVGDHVQLAKAGVLEVADILVVNKSDDPGSRPLAAQLRAMVERNRRIHVTAGKPAGPESDWTSPVVPTVATDGEGIDALVQAVAEHGDHLTRTRPAAERYRERIAWVIKEWALETTRIRLSTMRYSEDEHLKELVDRVVEQRTDVYRAAAEILEGH